MSNKPTTREYPIIIGRHTLRALALGELVSIHHEHDGAVVYLIHASDYPSGAILAALEDQPDEE